MRKYQNKLMSWSNAIGAKICHFILDVSHYEPGNSIARTKAQSTCPRAVGSRCAQRHCESARPSAIQLVALTGSS
jgi:hypothetical protein